MAVRKIVVHLDHGGNEIQNANFQNLASAPGSPTTGRFYYDTALGTMRYWNGSAWVTASGGTPADATTSTKGIVQLAGDLAGTATAPVIAALAVTDAKVAAANKDGASATPSLRTLGFGSAQALSGTTRLDQIAAPTNPVAFGSQRATGLADPSAAQDAATKAYVDNIAAGFDVKGSVRVATTAAGTLATSFANGQTVDGVTIATGDRILVKDQAAPAENGVYTVNASGAPTRATDFDAWTKVPGAIIPVEVGTANADTLWLSTGDQGGTIGTTALTLVRFGPGASVPAASITGQVAIANGGTGASTASAARTALGAVGKYSSATHAAGTTITITAGTHGLGAGRDKSVTVLEEATGDLIDATANVAANGDVTVTFNVSQTANTIRVTIIG